MTIVTQLTQKDFLTFSLNASKKMAAVLAILLILGLSLLLFVVLQVTVGVLPDLPFPWPALFVGIIMMGVPLMLFLGIRRNFKLNTSLHGPISYSFSPMGMDLAGHNFTASYTWDQIYSVTETSTLVMVWLAPTSASIIPKRFFKADELETFRSLHAKAA